MAQAKKQSQSTQNQALEMQMRDVLDGLEEMACYISYKAVDDSFEILSIEQPPEQDPLLQVRRASVHDLTDRQKQHKQQTSRTKRQTKSLYIDIADYLIIREQQRAPP